MNKIDILFAVIAFREAEFYSNIAQYLKENKGITSAFLTFYEPADSYLINKGYKVFSLHKGLKGNLKQYDNNNVNFIKRKYNVDNIDELLFHEMHTFCRFNKKKLICKLLRYDSFFEKLLSENEIKLICQELGGFVAPLSLYYNAKFKRIDHVFFEPSFFKGYLFFDKNTLEADLDFSVEVKKDEVSFVKKYVEESIKNKSIVIPEKDRHHFKDANLSKLINKRNIFQLSKKIFYKYITRKKEEYNAIFNHVKQNIKRVIRRFFLSKSYRLPDFSEDFFYFPLHVPIDFALTVRQRKFYDQFLLIDKIKEELPENSKLYIKEHPAAIGAYSVKKLKNLLSSSRVKLIRPDISSYDLIKKSIAVITINSKVGMEALMMGKKVLALGKSYYSSARDVIAIKDITEIKNIVKNTDLCDIDYNFFTKIYKNSYKGELYNNSERNIKNISEALLAMLK